MPATLTRNPSRAELLEQFRRRTSLSTTRETSTFRPLQGTEVKYDFEQTLARLEGSDHASIAAAAEADARTLATIGTVSLWTGVAVWLLGAITLAAGMIAVSIPALVVGSIAFFYGASQRAWSRHERRLIRDLDLLAQELQAR